MNDTQIINAIKNKDEAAIARLMEKYSALLWSVAEGILSGIGSVHDSEEVVADVFVSLWQQPEKYDPARGNLKNYLCLRCRSMALDRYRSLERRRTEDLDDLVIPFTEDPESVCVKEEELALLRQAMEELSEKEKSVLIGRYDRGLRPPEIGAELGLTTRQVENLLYRSKEKLRKALLVQKGNR